MKKSFFIAAIAALAFLASSCQSGNKSEAAAEAQDTEVVEATAGVIACSDDAQFRPGMKVDKLTVLDFNATWCIPCKKLTPAFDRAAEKFAGKADFYAIDIDNNPQTAQAFGIASIPTVVFLSPDGAVKTCVGLGDFVGDVSLENLDESQLTDVISDNMNKMIEAAL